MPKPIEWPDKISVYHKLGTVLTNSFTLNVISNPPLVINLGRKLILGGLVLSEKHQRPAARCLDDIVIYNYRPADKTQRPGKALIPGFVKAQFDEITRLQKDAKEDALDNIKDITEKIDVLERRVLGRKEMI